MQTWAIAVHITALSLIAVGITGRFYFGKRALEAREELTRRWWAAHDEDMAAISAGTMTADEADERRKSRYHP